ncbi:MAG TPA: PKD domain-containing protein, partial [Chitinophagales bacterium]|nr:PKD domain-containing protein [Chitinophagales bacterium]
NYVVVYGVYPRISATPISGCTPLIITFRDSSRSYLGSIVSDVWSFGNGDSSFVQNPVYTYDTGGAEIVSLTVTDSHGCKSNYRLTVTPIEIIADFSGDTVLCPGEAANFLNLSSTNANRFIWYFGDGDSSTLRSPTHAYSTSGEYTVTLISSYSSLGCKDTFKLSNYVHVDTPNIDFYVNSNFSPCPPFPVQFNNTTQRNDLTWVWNFGDGNSSVQRDPLHVYFFPGDYTVTLTATDSFGCVGSRQYIQLIHVRGPIGHFHLTPDAGCEPLSVIVTGTTASTVSSIEDMGDGTTFNNTVNLTHIYSTPGTYYPVFTLTDSLGCIVAYPVDTVLVGAIPYPNLPRDTSVCRGNYVQFTLTSGDHFNWTASSSPDYLTCDTCRITTTSSPDTITYYVTVTSNLGCSATDTVTVNVDPLPQIFPGINFRICPHDTIQLQAGQNVASATWSPNLYISDTSVVNPYVWPPDTVIYRVTGSNSLGCSVSRIVKIWPITKVVADLAVTDTMVCEATDFPLDVIVSEASIKDTSFMWTPSQHLSSATSQSPIFSAPPGDYNYTVIISSSTCIPDTAEISIQVNPIPDIISGDNQTVAVGTTVQLFAASHDRVNYVWTPAADSLTCTNCRRPYITINQDQVVYVAAINDFGCKAIDSVILKVVACDPKMIFVPNTFTPNNDGLDDKLFVRGIGLKQLDYFRVFDRWGKLMFETHDISQGWDGTIGGKPAAIATYVYVLKGICTSDAPVELSGNVTLIR